MTDIGMALKGSYDYRQVALSVLIATLAAYAALAQGFYFSKPVTAQEAGILLEKHPKW
jgi:NO-binding membrane sensor protein with MHYT domain